jgi:hypothetical protein
VPENALAYPNLPVLGKFMDIKFGDYYVETEYSAQGKQMTLLFDAEGKQLKSIK